MARDDGTIDTHAREDDYGEYGDDGSDYGLWLAGEIDFSELSGSDLIRAQALLDESHEVIPEAGEGNRIEP